MRRRTRLNAPFASYTSGASCCIDPIDLASPSLRSVYLSSISTVRRACVCLHRVYPGASINTSLTNRIIASSNATRHVIEDREGSFVRWRKARFYSSFKRQPLDVFSESHTLRHRERNVSPPSDGSLASISARSGFYSRRSTNTFPLSSFDKFAERTSDRNSFAFLSSFFIEGSKICRSSRGLPNKGRY